MRVREKEKKREGIIVSCVNSKWIVSPDGNSKNTYWCPRSLQCCPLTRKQLTNSSHQTVWVSCDEKNRFIMEYRKEAQCLKHQTADQTLVSWNPSTAELLLLRRPTWATPQTLTCSSFSSVSFWFSSSNVLFHHKQSSFHLNSQRTIVISMNSYSSKNSYLKKMFIPLFFVTTHLRACQGHFLLVMKTDCSSKLLCEQHKKGFVWQVQANGRWSNLTNVWKETKSHPELRGNWFR